jgi:hypothetical protein
MDRALMGSLLDEAEKLIPKGKKLNMFNANTQNSTFAIPNKSSSIPNNQSTILPKSDFQLVKGFPNFS